MIGAGRSWRGLPAFCLITGKMVSLTSVCIKSYSDVILTHEFFVSRFESAAREAGGAFKSRLTEPAEGGCSGAVVRKIRIQIICPSSTFSKA